MKSHLHAERPDALFIWPTPKAIAPPKAPASVARSEDGSNTDASFVGRIPKGQVVDQPGEEACLGFSEMHKWRPAKQALYNLPASNTPSRKRTTVTDA